MKKRLAAVLLSAGMAAGMFAAGVTPAQAACSKPGPKNSPVLQNVPVVGTRIYGAQAGPTGGYIGASGSSGYIQADGDATSGGSIHGEAYGTPIEGRIVIGTSPKVCVANTNVL